jgi:hypothetical protein
MPNFYGDGKVTMSLMNQGTYPLYDVRVTIVDQDLFATLVKKSNDVSRDIGKIQNESENFYKIGNLGQNQSLWIAKFDLDPKLGERNFIMSLLARNGKVNEFMRLRWVNDHWSTAVKALNQKGVVEEDIDRDYPQDQRDFP